MNIVTAWIIWSVISGILGVLHIATAFNIENCHYKDVKRKLYHTCLQKWLLWIAVGWVGPVAVCAFIKVLLS